jgi:hypothetical protein
VETQSVTLGGIFPVFAFGIPIGFGEAESISVAASSYRVHPQDSPCVLIVATDVRDQHELITELTEYLRARELRRSA